MNYQACDKSLEDYSYGMIAAAKNFLLANPEEIMNQVNTYYCASQAWAKNPNNRVLESTTDWRCNPAANPFRYPEQSSKLLLNLKFVDLDIFTPHEQRGQSDYFRGI